MFVELAGQPLRRIVAQLQAREIAAPRGDWSPSQVSRMLAGLGPPSSGGLVHRGTGSTRFGSPARRLAWAGVKEEFRRWG